MKQFLIIGLDGAEPALVEQWMEEGRMPALARLRGRGSFLRCDSTIPPATFPAWTTCVTGANPGRHGIFDFTEVVPDTRRLRFINSAHRQAPPLWTLLSDAGKRVVVLGVPGTYPPDRVNGIMVSGFDSPVASTLDASFVYPPERFPEVRRWRFGDFQETHIDAGWHDQALPKLLIRIADKETVALDLMAREPWDFFMAVFGESDTVSHHFWMFHDPASPRHRPGPADAIQQVYERLDQAVGRMVEAAGDDTAVAVVSDHGFGGAGATVAHINNWLAEQDYLVFTPRDQGSLLKRLALATIPQRFRGPVFRRFEGAAARAESRSRFGGIDWLRTHAWSEELNYAPSIRLNLKGRDPEGQVTPAAYDDICHTLCVALEGWPPVAKAWRRDELYHGPWVERAPDIIIEPALDEAGYAYSFLRGRGGPSLRTLPPEAYVGGKEKGMNGTHRPEGILLLTPSTLAGHARLEDLAPTVLAHLDVAAPPMDGVSLWSPPAYAPDALHSAAPPQAYTQEQEEAIARRLRALGYFE